MFHIRLQIRRSELTCSSRTWAMWNRTATDRNTTL